MSLNKNLKFSDYKNVIIQNDDAGKFPLLLTDLINASGAADDAKIIASIFLYAKKSNSDTNGFLILKPKCLWLSKSSGQLLDANGHDVLSLLACGASRRETLHQQAVFQKRAHEPQGHAPLLQNVVLALRQH